jgi:hypothetical protein
MAVNTGGPLPAHPPVHHSPGLNQARLTIAEQNVLPRSAGGLRPSGNVDRHTERHLGRVSHVSGVIEGHPRRRLMRRSATSSTPWRATRRMASVQSGSPKVNAMRAGPHSSGRRDNDDVFARLIAGGWTREGLCAEVGGYLPALFPA